MINNRFSIKNSKNPLVSFSQKFGPLSLSLYVALSSLLILFFFRTFLTILYLERFAQTPGYLNLFFVGIRMDIILIAYALMMPTIITFLLPNSVIRKINPLIIFWCTGFLCILIYMEIATFPFVAEYDLRPDQKFVEYLGHVNEVAGTLFKVYKFELTAGFFMLVFSSIYFWKTLKFLSLNHREWNYKVKLVLLPVVVLSLVLTARSSFGPRPANLSTAAFSNNHLANEFALNSTYSLMYSIYRKIRYEKNPSLFYGGISKEEIFERVSKNSILAGERFQNEIPFSQKQISPFKYDRPPNVVIFLQESMGASDVGCLSGPDITPNLCALKKEGLWLNNLYATGTRTVRGIEAIVSGFLPTAATGVVKLGLAKENFFTAASVFKNQGYNTSFIYGGMSNFDEMKTFFLGNDFQEIYDQPTFENPKFLGTWGVSDEDLVVKANQIFLSNKDKPFFSVILSTSNHLPYEFPDGRIDLYEQPKQTHHNAIKYADYAIGLLFELAKKEEYFKNTIFLIVADHNSHVRGNDFVPISKFHIPALMIGPNVPTIEYDRLSSQIDLLPTILHFTGLNSVHPLIGRNLMNLPEETAGRAFMQYGDNNAYQVNDQVIIQRPYLEPLQYVNLNNNLTPTKLNKELARDALAYSHLPWILYSEKLYRNPKINE
jgi:phosphoglycerol transferase MdoB-like AlkP superfamily enzyme